MTYRTIHTRDYSKTVYICDLCDTEYKNKEDAKKCENEHVRPEETVNYKINVHQKYPHEIEVRFADGTRHEYVSKTSLLDKVVERINNLHYDTCDNVTRRIEHQLKAEVFKVIDDMKSEEGE